nr:MAG: hypothetical protein [Porcellio scaber clopovirus]
MVDDNDGNKEQCEENAPPPYFDNPLFKILGKYINKRSAQKDEEEKEEIRQESLSIFLNACGKSFLENIPVIEKYKFNTDEFKVHKQQKSKFSLDDQSFVQLKQNVSRTLYELYGPSPPLISSTLVCPVYSFAASFSEK